MSLGAQSQLSSVLLVPREQAWSRRTDSHKYFDSTVASLQKHKPPLGWPALFKMNLRLLLFRVLFSRLNILYVSRTDVSSLEMNLNWPPLIPHPGFGFPFTSMLLWRIKWGMFPNNQYLLFWLEPISGDFGWEAWYTLDMIAAHRRANILDTYICIQKYISPSLINRMNPPFLLYGRGTVRVGWGHNFIFMPPPHHCRVWSPSSSCGKTNYLKSGNICKTYILFFLSCNT